MVLMIFTGNVRHVGDAFQFLNWKYWNYWQVSNFSDAKICLSDKIPKTFP